jgi:bifunctional DNA-binding transcriptional regulator/antitoxin component of YhaV-PrlF toxin-antitoxin module
LYCSTGKLEQQKIAMDIVTVKNKFQIVIPQHIRKIARIEIGDLLEAGVENGKIVFSPKSLIDRHIAEGLEDVRKGRTHGPYATASEAIEALETRSKRSAKKRRS